MIAKKTKKLFWFLSFLITFATQLFVELYVISTL